jgi:hypothetical protein
MAAKPWNPSSFAFLFSFLFHKDFDRTSLRASWWDLVERVGWSGGNLDLVWTFVACIDDSAWFLKVWMCCSRLFFVVIFGALSCWFSWGVFGTLLLGIWWGKFVGTLRGSLCYDSPPKSMSIGARFLGFPCSRVRGVLGGISSIPPFLTSFGGIKLGYGLLMRCSYYPQSLVQVCGAIREIEVLQVFRVWVSLEVGRPVWWFGGFQAWTGLTGVLHRADRCEAT